MPEKLDPDMALPAGVSYFCMKCMCPLVLNDSRVLNDKTVLYSWECPKCGFKPMTTVRDNQEEAKHE